MSMVAPPSVARHPRVPASAAAPLQNHQQLAPMPLHAAAAAVDMYMGRVGVEGTGYAPQQQPPAAAPQGRSMGVNSQFVYQPINQSAQAVALGAHQPVPLQPAAVQPPMGTPQHTKQPAPPQPVTCQLAPVQSQQLGQPSCYSFR